MNHIKREHSKEPPASILCTDCGVVSTGFIKHVEHMETHAMASCNICKKKFRYSFQTFFSISLDIKRF